MTKRKVYGGIFLLLFFVSLISFGAALRPKEAKAQWAVFDPSNWASMIWGETKEAAREEKKNWRETIKDKLQTAADIAFKNSLRVFFGRLAEDTAIWLASAGTGQKPLFMTDPDYWNKLVDATAGDAIYSLGEEVFGVDICDADLEVKMNITLALGKTYNPKNWCNDSCRWVFGNTNESIMERYSDTRQQVGADFEGPLSEKQYTGVPKEGTIQYFQYYNTDSRFPEFAVKNPGGFLCPVQCNNQASPGMLCSKPYYEPNPTQSYATTRENLQGCINTLVYLQRLELKKSQQNLSACFKNCSLSKRSGGERKAKCSATEAFANMKKMGSQLMDQKLVGDTIGLYLQPEQNDLGQLLITYDIIEEKTKKELSREKTIWESPGIGPLTTTLSTDIISPRELTKKRGELVVEKSTSAEEVRTGSWAADVIRVFTNTLVNKLIERFFGGKCALNPSASECAGIRGGSRLSQLYFGSGGPAGIAAAKLQFSSISKVEFTRGSPGDDPVNSGDLTSKGIIDSGFQTAIDQEMTVGEAINKGLIGGVLGFDIEGQEPSIDSGIPYRSILYLRKYRVVPVGWELAAKWIKDHPQNITLEELAREEFTRCEKGSDRSCSDDPVQDCVGNSDCYDPAAYPSCNDRGDCAAGYICHSEGDGGRNACYEECDPDAPACSIPDYVCRPIAPANVVGYCVNPNEPFCRATADASPFCGLIDPNWVIKMPDTYCQKKGATEEIVTKDFICDEDTNQDGEINCEKSEGNDPPDIGYWQVIRNTDQCVNEISCLKEDSQGKCLKYGYCYEERPIWRFNGQECDRQYASCQSYEASDGSQVSYLNNTVYVNGCTAANAGCRWYCKDPNYDETNKTWTCTKSTPESEKIYFDRDIKTCSEADVGCQEYIETGSGANLVMNSSFEYYAETDEVDDGNPDSFKDVNVRNPADLCGNQIFAVSDSFAGSVALKQHDRGCCDPAVDCSQYIGIRVNTGYPILNRTFTFSFYGKADAYVSDLRTVVKNGIGGGPWIDVASQLVNFNTEWQRYVLTFTVSNLAGGILTPVAPNDLVLVIGNGQSPINTYIDAVQLEENNLSEYKDYGSVNKIYLNGDRVYCAERDVGCEKYTPTAGGPSIPGVVYANNLCSKEKVGCESFREMPTGNIPLRPAVDPVYFVSGTGTKCDASSVGCEEYTNLDVVASGGEDKEYYRKIKQCVKPGAPNVGSYYTWEGNDTTGYQLKAYRLKRSDSNSGPCTSLSIEPAGTEPSCRDAALGQATCQPAQMASNPDCREFYDSNANVYYILKSRVIEETDECYPYRNTIDAQSKSPGDPDLIYYLNPKGSLKCPSGHAGCREYKGNTGSVTRPVFSDNFENAQIGASNWVNGDISNESVRANEHSLRVTNNATATQSEALLKGKINQDQYYQLSFWLKPETATQISSIAIVKASNPGDQPQYFLNPSVPPAPITVTGDWNLYQFGPLRFNRPVTEEEQLDIVLNGHFFIDNVVLEEVVQTAYLIKNSYRTCAASELGCREYKDSKGRLHYISSFDHLCSEKFVGCQSLINTQNSTNPYRQTIRGITILDDKLENVVNSSTYYCAADAKGCNRFGLPNLSQIGEPTSWETKYLINDPDKYEYITAEGDFSIVCLREEDGCDEYTYLTGGGAKWFKDPGEKTCEYKSMSNTEGYQWYRTGTNLLCPYITPPPEGKPVGMACIKRCNTASGPFAATACVQNSDCGRWCSGGVNNGQACELAADCPGGNCQSGACVGAGSLVGTTCSTLGMNTECRLCEGGTADGEVLEDVAQEAACVAGGGVAHQMLCDYWVGLCPEEQSGCNEYRDPSDPDPCRSSCSLETVGVTPVPVDDNCEPTVCQAGPRAGDACYSTNDCSGGTCSGVGLPGCRSYYYIRDSVEADKEKCGQTVNPEEGCLPFNDTSNPVLNMRGQ